MNASDHQRAIHETTCRYARAVDRRDWTLLKELFTADAVLRGPGFTLQGPQAIVEGMAALERFSLTQHHLHQQLVEIDGDRASAETYCVANHLYERDGVKRKLDWGLRYLDRLVRDGAAWRFSSRDLLLEWSQDLPLEG